MNEIINSPLKKQRIQMMYKKQFDKSMVLMLLMCLLVLLLIKRFYLSSFFSPFFLNLVITVNLVMLIYYVLNPLVNSFSSVYEPQYTN